MVIEHIQRREKTVQLPKSTREAISKFYAHVQRSKGVKREAQCDDESSSDFLFPPEVKRRRCHLCPSQRSKMQKQICSQCYKNVCNEHSTFTRECSACKNL